MSRVLVVEDEEFLIRPLKDSLAAEGYTVDVARNGKEAVGKITENKPDLVLLDILMPEKDGFYVLGEVKKSSEWRLIPVIVLSNLGEDVTIKQALEAGADDYFVKSQHPIQEIIERAKDYLEGRKTVKPRS